MRLSGFEYFLFVAFVWEVLKLVKWHLWLLMCTTSKCKHIHELTLEAFPSVIVIQTALRFGTRLQTLIF